jgi:segregation and condensation protein A
LRLDKQLAEQILSSPWRILFDVTRLDRIKVWEVRLNDVLSEFSRTLRIQGYIDFNIAGIAVLSAATIHRIKTEKLLQGDVPPKPKVKPDISVLPPIELPLRPEVVTATIQEVVTALQRALTQAAREKTSTVPPPVQENRLILADFLVKIEEELGRFLERLAEIFSQRDMITFSELVKGLPRIEAAKTFILLLFAAARHVVFLSQTEDQNDLIVLKGVADGGGG